MKLVSYEHGKRRSAGVLLGDDIIALAPLFGRREGELDLEDIIPDWRVNKAGVEAYIARAAPTYRRDEVRLVAPLSRPQKIVAIGSNYPRPGGAAAPEGMPVLFFKPPSAITGPYDPILLPPEAGTVIGEVELAVVIGKPGTRIAARDAACHVFGYMVANDITAPEILLGESSKNPLFLQQSRGKGFKTFCPMGPWIETAAELPFPPAWDLRQDVGDYLEISGHTGQMMTGIADLVADISGAFGLEACDIILTGSPPPAAGKRTPLVPGTILHSEIAGLGWMANPVVRG